MYVDLHSDNPICQRPKFYLEKKSFSHPLNTCYAIFHNFWCFSEWEGWDRPTFYRPYIRGLHGPIFQARTRPTWLEPWHGPSRSKEKIFLRGPSTEENVKFLTEPGWPETKYKILARVSPGQIFFWFQPGTLCFTCTDPFSCLHIINVIFCWWFIFLKFIKTTDLILTTYR